MSEASVPPLKDRESHEKHVTAGSEQYQWSCVYKFDNFDDYIVCKIYTYLFARRVLIYLTSSSL